MKTECVIYAMEDPYTNEREYVTDAFKSDFEPDELEEYLRCCIGNIEYERFAADNYCFVIEKHYLT